MDAELKKALSLIKNKGATVNGSPTSETYSSTTDSLENIRDELVVADAAIDAVQADLGDMADAATSDTLADIATTSALAKLRRILLRFSADAFSATIAGGARTDVETMFNSLATYFAAAGAALSIQINGNAARDNFEQVLEDLSVVFGADGANVFNPTIQGATRTDLDTALAQLATYIAASGAAYSSTVNPGGSVRTNIEQVLEDLSDVLAGAGITTYPSGAAPGNGISLAEGLRYVSELTDTAETTGPYSYLDAGAEQDVVTDAVTTRRHIWLEFSNQNMTQTGTFRIYRKIDGVTYDLYATIPVTVSAGDERAFDVDFVTNQHWKLSYQENVDEAAARDIDFNIVTQVIE